MARLETIKYQGKDYATVPVRLKQFREDNPRAEITTQPTFLEDGGITFQATIIQDRKDEYSAKATGTAMYTKAEVAQKKAFEKLETISIGRALAVLGYLNDGQVATTEEMVEFNEYRDKKVDDTIAEMTAAADLDELKFIFMSSGTLMSDPRVIAAKDERKAELLKETEK